MQDVVRLAHAWKPFFDHTVKCCCDEAKSQEEDAVIVTIIVRMCRV